MSDDHSAASRSLCWLSRCLACCAFVSFRGRGGRSRTHHQTASSGLFPMGVTKYFLGATTVTCWTSNGLPWVDMSSAPWSDSKNASSPFTKRRDPLKRVGNDFKRRSTFSGCDDILTGVNQNVYVRDEDKQMVVNVEHEYNRVHLTD
jgi:hypothetical protein